MTPDPTETVSHAHRSAGERLFERTMFTSRWLVAPIYVAMIGGLFMLLLESGRVLIRLASAVIHPEHLDVQVAILELVDLSFVGNLLLMVMFAGYENFVSQMYTGEGVRRLDWMGTIGFGDLKIKLITSIIAISAIRLLERFMDLDHATRPELIWTVAIYMTFVISGLLLVVMERLQHR